MNEQNLERKITGDDWGENNDGLWPKTDVMRTVFGWGLGIVFSAGMLYGIHAAHKREYAAMSPYERKIYDAKQKRGPLIIVDLAEGFLHKWGGVPHRYPWEE